MVIGIENLGIMVLGLNGHVQLLQLQVIDHNTHTHTHTHTHMHTHTH